MGEMPRSAKLAEVGVLSGSPRTVSSNGSGTSQDLRYLFS